MPKYTFGALEQDIDSENEAAFEAAGWRPDVVPSPKPKLDEKHFDK